MKVIHQLIDYFTERGVLTARHLERLVERGYWGQYTSENVRALEGRVGESFYFQVTGSEFGPLWGTDVYTSDSSLGVACVHAGLLKPGEAGAVRVSIVAPPAVFRGSTRHGVTSQDWKTPWSGAYRVEAVRK
jgi:hypothetical protein